MRILKAGDSGADVEQWQYYLLGEEYHLVEASGMFDEATVMGTKAFQANYGIVPDGVVNEVTYNKAVEFGFVFDDDPSDDHLTNVQATEEWPPLPGYQTYTPEQLDQLFGKIEFEPLASGNIKVLNNWVAENLVEIVIPQLNKIGQKWGHDNGKILFHKKGARQMIMLWEEWEKNGLLPLVTDWCCSYGPRYIRGSSVRLSTHAYGISFDINIRTNALGIVPPLVGQKGSVRPLVPIANKLGFFWGGHFRKRKDGMHFEIAKLL